MNNLSDKELADKVVALGVGKKKSLMRILRDGSERPEEVYEADPRTISCMSAKEFVTDWRVAGTLMEEIRDRGDVFGWVEVVRDIRHVSLGVNLPRTIIEACVEALQ